MTKSGSTRQAAPSGMGLLLGSPNCTGRRVSGVLANANIRTPYLQLQRSSLTGRRLQRVYSRRAQDSFSTLHLVAYSDSEAMFRFFSFCFCIFLAFDTSFLALFSSCSSITTWFGASSRLRLEVESYDTSDFCFVRMMCGRY